MAPTERPDIGYAMIFPSMTHRPHRLVMFLYASHPLRRQFFSMSGTAGIKYNLLALVACVAGLIVALLLGQAYGIKIGHTLGSMRAR